MGRILAIDYGRKRCGLAVTDPGQIICTPLASVNSKDLENFLTEYTLKEKVDEFVVGYPVQMNNTPSEAVKYIEPFVRRLRKLFPGIPVRLEDERFTSKIAFQSMIDGGIRKSGRRDKAAIDRISASIILQSYLEKAKNKNSGREEKAEAGK